VAGTSADVSAMSGNASDSIHFNLESDSDEIEEKDPQQKKYHELRISMICGMTIEFSKKMENASDSIRFSLESDSIEIDERIRNGRQTLDLSHIDSKNCSKIRYLTGKR
jgi:hypothetical protein